jgi:hypothetical protein
MNKAWIFHILQYHDFWIVSILTLGLIFQIAVAPFSAHLYDMNLWFDTGNFIINGAYSDTDNPVYNIYTYAKREFAAGTFPEGAYIYTPLWAYICAFSYLGTQFLSNLGFSLGGQSYFLQLFIYKLPVILSNMLIAILLVKLAQLHNLKAKYTYFLLLGYLFNPYVIEVSTIWGNFHNIATLFVLLSYYFFQTGKHEYSLISLGMGIAVKLYPIFLVPLYLLKIKWSGIQAFIKNLLLVFSPTILICLPFLIWDFNSFISVMLLSGLSTSCNNFSWWSGIWRLLNIYVLTPTDPLSYENPLLATMVILTNVITYSSLLFSYIWFRKKNLPLLSGILLSFICLYVTNRYIQETWVIWIIPFVLLDIMLNKESFGTLWLLPLLVFGGTHSFFGDPVWVLWGDWFRQSIPFSKLLYQNIDWIVRYIYTFLSAVYIIQILRKSGFSILIPLKSLSSLLTRLKPFHFRASTLLLNKSHRVNPDPPLLCERDEAV